MSFTIPPPNAITTLVRSAPSCYHLFGQFLYRGKTLVQLRHREGKAASCAMPDSASASAPPRCRQTVSSDTTKTLPDFAGMYSRRSRDYAALHDSVVRSLGRFHAKSWHTPLLTCVVIAPPSLLAALSARPLPSWAGHYQIGKLSDLSYAATARSLPAIGSSATHSFRNISRPALASNSTQRRSLPCSCPVAIRFETGCTTSRSIARFKCRAPYRGSAPSCNT